MRLTRACTSAAILVVFGSITACAADWNKQRAAQYLDSRQKAWFEWRAGKTDPGGPCLSCHTGVTFLQARPALRRALDEKEPTAYETGLRDAIGNRLDHAKLGRMFPSFVKEPLATQAAAVESVVSAFALALGSGASEAFLKALDRMLLTQSKAGNSHGGWPWFQLGLSPWEAVESGFYGATLAAMTLESAPAAYLARPDVRMHIADLEDYLKREFAAQPLHHRLFLLWSSARIGNAVPLAARQAAIDEALRKQREDGSWSIASLGPWKSHANVSDSAAGDSYATAIATLALQRVNGDAGRGVVWLRSHQDAATGAWLSKSMNKTYPADSIEAQFMSEAATSYAVLALIEADRH